MATMKLSVKEALENTPNLSLRKIALAADVTYGILLKASKKPIAGVPYDPECVNYGAIDEVLAKRNIDLSELDLIAIAGEARAKAIKENDISIGDVYTLRGGEVSYVVVALTKSHICLQAMADDDEAAEIPLRAMSIPTFLHQTPKKVVAVEE